MERYYSFAGVELVVSMPADMMYANERRLAPFAVDKVKEPYIFQFEKVSFLLEPEGSSLVVRPNLRIYQEGKKNMRYIGSVQNDWENAYIRTVCKNREYQVQIKEKSCPERIGTHIVLDALEAEHLIARANGFIFHCAYIDHNGKAILFTAPSETGKSTQAELWNKYRGAEIINGDRAAVRLVDGRILAEGIPFAGSSEYCKNRSLPLEAIVYLGQAPKTSIRRMRGYEAFLRIWEGVSVNTWDKEDMELVSAVVKRIAETVPVFHMPCTPDEAAVIALEKVLVNGVIYE